MANALGGDVEEPEVRKGSPEAKGKGPAPGSKDRGHSQDLESRVTTLERNLEQLKGRLEEIKTVADEAAESSSTALRNIQDTGGRVSAVEKASGEDRARLDGLQQDYDGTRVEVGRLKVALKPAGAGGSVAPVKWARFLIIETRQYDLDPIARQALEEVAAATLRGVDVATLGAKIIDEGLGTAITKLSQQLARARISEPRRHLLARIYPALLEERLRPLDRKRVEDTAGLAGELLDLLDKEPVDAFANAVVRLSQQKMSLRLDAKQQDALKERVRASL